MKWCDATELVKQEINHVIKKINPGNFDRNNTTTTKMAAMKMSLASKLLNRVKKHDYNVVVPYLNPDTALSPRDVRQLKKLMHQSGKYVKTDKFYTRFGNTKPDAVFEVFGKYCGKSGPEVREMMVDYMYKHQKTIEAKFS